eukprot:TRINITY_DN2829_c0_g1_i1.p1 TRINITY_DN2829_c0_g1~~TRINITY_DN2829_c0_g1_i1.p1  ORF type:complete len:902 (+),score=195.71 TRINITY_DN2829_c0_g1_i1:75-2780(+)
MQTIFNLAFVLLCGCVFVSANATISVENEYRLNYNLVQCPGTTDSECLCPQTTDYECEEGFYCPNSPSFLEENKFPCTDGMFCPTNTAQAIYCCAGHYCPSPKEIKVCPEGHFCHTGLMEPTECAPLSDCPEGTKIQNKIGSLVLLVIVMAALIIGYTIAEYVINIRRGEKLQKMQEKKKKRIEQQKSIVISLESKKETYTITFEELGLTLPNGRKIMDGVTGELYPGTVTAVMGPSGAGKTTFLSLISGKVQKTKGTIKINGEVEDNGVTKYKKLVGFVPQEDTMLRMMTVKENLLFSARFRLPASYTSDKISLRISEVLDILGLVDVMYSVIGDERTRGISGGQRKRVNIGMELVADPSILFLDEPTSGLDSTASEEVCYCLKKISRLGLTISTVIHQPRYEIFAMFDRALLLGKGGRTVFQGNCKDALPYFTSIGFQLPPHGNPADFYMDVISGKSPRFIKRPLAGQDISTFTLKDMQRLALHHKLPLQLSDRLSAHEVTGSKFTTLSDTELESILGQSALHLAEIVRNPQNYTFLEQDPEFTKEQLFELWEKKAGTFRENSVYNTLDIFHIEIPFLTDFLLDFKSWFVDARQSLTSLFQKDPYRETPGFLWQFMYCFNRAFTQTYRDRNIIILGNALHLFAGLFLGIASRSLEFVGPLSPDLAPSCPYELIRRGKCTIPLSDNFAQSGNLLTWAIGFCGIAAGATTFGHEKVVFWRDSSAGLNPFSYFFAKIMSDIPRLLLAGSCFFLAYVLVFSPSGAMYELYGLMLALYYAGFGCGYFVSQLVHPEAASMVGVAFALVWSIVFSGTNPRLKSVPDEYGESSMFLWDISYARWGVEAFYVLNIKPFDHEDLSSALRIWSYDLDNYGKCILNILGIGTMWRMISLVMLLAKDRQKKK